MALILIKIDFADVINQCVEYVNRIMEAGQELNKPGAETCDYVDEVHKATQNMEAIDMKFKIVCTHLEAIANRAILIGDTEMIDRFKALGVITDESSQEELQSVPSGAHEGNQEAPSAQV